MVGTRYVGWMKVVLYCHQVAEALEQIQLACVTNMSRHPTYVLSKHVLKLTTYTGKHISHPEPDINCTNSNHSEQKPLPLLYVRKLESWFYVAYHYIWCFCLMFFCVEYLVEDYSLNLTTRNRGWSLDSHVVSESEFTFIHFTNAVAASYYNLPWERHHHRNCSYSLSG